MNDNDRHKSGPLNPPSPPPTEEAVAALEKLRGHGTSELWLRVPEGIFGPEFDELRERHARVRSQIVAELEALDGLRESFDAEDREYDRQLQEAHRRGDLGAVEDTRTPTEQREAELQTLVERSWSGFVVLAEVRDAVLELSRPNEEPWLADLRRQDESLLEEERELEKKLAEARARGYHKALLARWLLDLNDDGPFAMQPAPVPTPPPPIWTEELRRRSLERPWHRPRTWLGEGTERVVSWQELSSTGAAPDDDEALEHDELEAATAAADRPSAGDPTGVVEPLDETVAGTAA